LTPAIAFLLIRTPDPELASPAYAPAVMSGEDFEEVSRRGC
jgi:hypothetical protein